jgi:hypothetical protein
MNCAACETGPKGIDGHPHLVRSETAPRNIAIFQCEICRQRYSRQYQGSGVFVWIKVPGRGVALEARADSSTGAKRLLPSKAIATGCIVALASLP